VRTAGDSLRLPARGRRDRGEHGPRLWAFACSLALHAALLYLASDWVARQALRTPPRAFVVNLVMPVPEAAQTEAPDRPRPAPAESPARRSPTEPIPPGRPGRGVTEAPRLQPTPEPPAALELPVPARGESTRAPEAIAAPRELDAAESMAERLLEEMEMAAVPRSLGEAERSEVTRREPARRLGSAAGITGELGQRGLLYMEQPPYAEWGRRMGVEADVRFRFWVSAEGHVVRILAVKKSAYPEFESLARVALARWRFEPLPRGQGHEEWGEVPFRYELHSSDAR